MLLVSQTKLPPPSLGSTVILCRVGHKCTVVGKVEIGLYSESCGKVVGKSLKSPENYPNFFSPGLSSLTDSAKQFGHARNSPGLDMAQTQEKTVKWKEIRYLEELVIYAVFLRWI